MIEGIVHATWSISPDRTRPFNASAWGNRRCLRFCYSGNNCPQAEVYYFWKQVVYEMGMVWLHRSGQFIVGFSRVKSRALLAATNYADGWL